MLSRLQLKRFLSDEHSIEEHLEKIYEILFEIIDEIETLKSSDSRFSDKIMVNLKRR